MNVPADMQQRLLSTRAELQSVKARMGALNQSKQLLQVTQAHIDEEETSGRVWQGVGRMFVSTPATQYKTDVASRVASLDEQISALQKKESYYATTLEKMILAVSKADS